MSDKTIMYGALALAALVGGYLLFTRFEGGGAHDPAGPTAGEQAAATIGGAQAQGDQTAASVFNFMTGALSFAGTVYTRENDRAEARARQTSNTSGLSR